MEGEGEDERYRYSVYTARGSGADASGGAVVASEEAEGALLLPARAWQE